LVKVQPRSKQGARASSLPGAQEVRNVHPYRLTTQADHGAESVAPAWIAASLLYGSPTTYSPPCWTKAKPLWNRQRAEFDVWFGNGSAPDHERPRAHGSRKPCSGRLPRHSARTLGVELAPDQVRTVIMAVATRVSVMEWAPLIWRARDPRMMAGETKQYQGAPTGPLLRKRANAAAAVSHHATTCARSTYRLDCGPQQCALVTALDGQPAARRSVCPRVDLTGMPLVAAWPSKASTPSPIGARAALPERMGRLPPTAPPAPGTRSQT
jgi:hypothetical protein